MSLSPHVEELNSEVKKLINIHTWTTVSLPVNVLCISLYLNLYMCCWIEISLWLWYDYRYGCEYTTKISNHLSFYVFSTSGPYMIPHNPRGHTYFQHATHTIHVAFPLYIVYLKKQVHILFATHVTYVASQRNLSVPNQHLYVCMFGLVLWHINRCRLFNPLFTYISNIWFLNIFCR